MSNLPACAGCGSTYTPRHSDDAACPDCVKWNLNTPPKYLKPGFRATNGREWAERWDEYWQKGAAA